MLNKKKKIEKKRLTHQTRFQSSLRSSGVVHQIVYGTKRISANPVFMSFGKETESEMDGPSGTYSS
jgi:hypothetical protein